VSSQDKCSRNSQNISDIQTRGTDTQVVVLTGISDVDLAVNAMKLGAFDYLRNYFFNPKKVYPPRPCGGRELRLPRRSFSEGWAQNCQRNNKKYKEMTKSARFLQKNTKK
jgi:PleD family two-component response regulator